MFDEYFNELNKKGVRIPLASDTTIMLHHIVASGIKFILERSRTSEILSREAVENGVHQEIEALKTKEPTLFPQTRVLSELVRTMARQMDIALGPKDDAVVYISSLVNTITHAILTESAMLVLDSNSNAIEPAHLLNATKIFPQAHLW